jgi:hypothetical protein
LRKKENEPRGVFRKAEEKRQAIVRTSISKRKMMKRTKIMDDNKKDMEAKVKNAHPPS